ncbi:MAG: zinc-ribbon domain containing protein [Clostridia bacterium]|nr:zinc-ribbon domain containing protein [Clostridia bacterium]
MYNDYQDETLVCRECNNEFVFSASEQAFYAEKGFTNKPARCRDCRNARKRAQNGGDDRPLFDAVCDECGASFQLRFQPNGSKPVYCPSCFQSRRPARF